MYYTIHTISTNEKKEISNVLILTRKEEASKSFFEMHNKNRLDCARSDVP